MFPRRAGSAAGSRLASDMEKIVAFPFRATFYLRTMGGPWDFITKPLSPDTPFSHPPQLA
jgi:hypothetical protein